MPHPVLRRTEHGILSPETLLGAALKAVILRVEAKQFFESASSFFQLRQHFFRFVPNARLVMTS
jgi:hypothetical protein